MTCIYIYIFIDMKLAITQAVRPDTPATTAQRETSMLLKNSQNGGRDEGWEPGQHYLALLRPDCNKAVPVEKLCFLPIELALLRKELRAL